MLYQFSLDNKREKDSYKRCIRQNNIRLRRRSGVYRWNINGSTAK